MALFKNTRRNTALEEFARRKGFAYEEQDSFGIRAYFKDMKLFRIGGSKKALNMMQRSEAEFNHSGMFDYHYTVSTGKSSRTFKQTVYFRIQNDLMLPAFKLFPEQWYHQIGKWFGMQDINFVEYPEFSKNYLLQGPQPEFIWKLFQDEDLVRHFDAYPGWSVEAVGKYFVMYKHHKLQPVTQMGTLLKTGDTLYRIFTERNAQLEKEFQK
jgi:hypothetical protein